MPPLAVEVTIGFGGTAAWADAASSAAAATADARESRRCMTDSLRSRVLREHPLTGTHTRLFRRTFLRLHVHCHGHIVQPPAIRRSASAMCRRSLRAEGRGERAGDQVGVAVLATAAPAGQPPENA